VPSVPAALDDDSVDPADFRSAMGAFATGVTVVTVGLPDGDRYGMTVNAFSSVSLDPPLVLVCLAGSGRGQQLIDRAGVFSVNVLAESQQELSRWFADRRRPEDASMFDAVAVGTGVTGCPVLLGAAASFDCRVDRIVAAGDHGIVIGEVAALRQRPGAAPLVFHAGGYRSLEAESPRPGRGQLRVV
jgi:flavin reductase (DIM6/NTAB) family NADH-FMN oxidoreductase RutF